MRVSEPADALCACVCTRLVHLFWRHPPRQNARLRMFDGCKIGQSPLPMYILAVTELQAGQGACRGGAAVAVLPGGQAGGGAAVHGFMVTGVSR